MTQLGSAIAEVDTNTLIQDSVKASLFAKTSDDVAAYAIIDGQWCEDIYGRLQGEENTDWCSLIAGELAHELALTAPYLVRLQPDTDLSNWLIGEGWGKGWGIYFLASKSRAKELYKTPPPESLKQQLARGAFVASPDITEDDANDVVLLRRHFRRYLRVEFESDGRLVRFRFFDPAVLRVWLLSTNPLETQAFFGPITDYIAEDWCEEPSLCHHHRLWHFAAPTSGESCKAVRFDMLSRQRTPITPLESSTQTNKRTKSHVTLVRKGQEKAFFDMQMELFIANVTEKLCAIGKKHALGTANFKELFAFSKQQINQAKSYGLETEYDLTGYVICSIYLGNNFQESNENFKAALVSKDRNALDRFFWFSCLCRG